MKPNEFWELTYAELFVMIEGYKRREIKQLNKFLFSAWYTAALSRAEEMPSLQSLMIREEDQGEEDQTDEDMMAMAKLWNAALGGIVLED